jgi:hypothetical protein
MLLRRLAITLAAFLALVVPALAAGTAVGTAAWLIQGQALLQGPGTQYDVVGELGDATAIRTYRWCRIHAQGQAGWVPRDDVAFGKYPRRHPTGPQLKWGSGSTICLYEGRNFSGEQVCASPGTVVRDLLLFHRDNTFSSVEVNGGSVILCRDRDFSSYCELIVEDQASLHGFLDNNVSSLRVK